MGELIGYPCVLTDGTVAYLHLPPVVSEVDAERLCQMVRSLPFDNDGHAVLAAPKEERPWPGFCQTCKAPLDPPDLTWCPTCGCSDEDE